MESWVDLGSLIAARPGIESTTAWSQVRRLNCYTTKRDIFVCMLIMQNESQYIASDNGENGLGDERAVGTWDNAPRQNFWARTAPAMYDLSTK